MGSALTSSARHKSLAHTETSAESRDEAVQKLGLMGLTPTRAADGHWLECGDDRLSLGAEPNWKEVVAKGYAWLETLGEEAGREGNALRARRVKAGFADLEAFAAFTSLDEGLVFEAEAGLAEALPVHERILDWLEAGRLKR